MNINKSQLMQLVKEEIANRQIFEAARNDRNHKPDLPEGMREMVLKALDVIEVAAEHVEDSDEVRWYLTKVGEAFGESPTEEGT